MKRFVGSLLYGLIMFLPVWFAAAYTVAIITLGALCLFGNMPSGVTAALTGLLWGYLGLAMISLYVYTVHSFRNCCIGMNSFGGHLHHTFFDGATFAERFQTLAVRLGSELLGALIWPWCWYSMISGYLGWGVDWYGVAVEPTTYWISTHRRGHKLEIVDYVEGTSETTYYQ